MDMDSILTSIKQLLGMVEEYEAFDGQIIIQINMAFAILAQLGVGPSTPFFISDKFATWSDFTIDGDLVNAVKTYIYLKVKQVFDPPANSFTQDSIQKQIDELQWRMLVDNDPDVESTLIENEEEV